jgi:hypothetical protein
MIADVVGSEKSSLNVVTHLGTQSLGLFNQAGRKPAVHNLLSIKRGRVALLTTLTLGKTKAQKGNCVLITSAGIPGFPDWKVVCPASKDFHMTAIQNQVERFRQQFEDQKGRNNYRYAQRMERAARKIKMGTGAVLPIFIVVLGIDRCFGGPEEGGWYYDWVNVEETRRVWDWKTARQAIRELREEYPDPKYGRGSVLGGTDIDIRLTTDVEEIETWQSTERPTYC